MNTAAVSAGGGKSLTWFKDAQEQRREFIAAWSRGDMTMAQLCRRHDISRKTGYRLIRRFQESGWEGLADRSRAPLHHPNETPRAVQEQLIAFKRRFPTYGPRKLLPELQRLHPDIPWPSASTISGLFQREGLSQPRKRVRRSTPWTEPFAHATHPNDVWCMDFKGWFRTRDGRRCDPLTVMDAATRYLLACQGLGQPRTQPVRQVLERTFEEYGLPRVVHTDNGPPFASTGLGGLSSLAVWWIKLGIIPERSAPGHPEQNGRLERFHRTLKAETAAPPQPTPRSQQRAFDAFRTRYNTERPHEALGQRPPATVYVPSFRPFPHRLPELEYGPGVSVRRVRSNGQIKWQGELVYLNDALRGELVGLTPRDDRHWAIQFGPLDIATLDTHAKTVLRTPVKVLPMCSG